ERRVGADEPPTPGARRGRSAIEAGNGTHHTRPGGLALQRGETQPLDAVGRGGAVHLDERVVRIAWIDVEMHPIAATHAVRIAIRDSVAIAYRARRAPDAVVLQAAAHLVRVAVVDVELPVLPDGKVVPV